MDVPRDRDGRLLDAAADLIADGGVGAVSFRRVAAAAGVSPAQVQYYFRSKSELVAGIFDRISYRFLSSLAPTLDEEPSLARLRRLVWQWLPLDAERERRARLWTAYAAFAVTDETLAAAHARVDQQLRDWFADDLAALRRTGRLRRSVSSQVAAGQLLALIDGTTIHSLVVPMGERAGLAERDLGTWIDSLGPSTGRRIRS